MKNEIRVDDRTESECAEYRFAVVGHDKFMSGWGEAKGMMSFAAWACKLEDVDKVFDWVKKRGDMRHICVKEIGKYFPKGHLHIYVCRPGHIALK